jgi:hypothetical protein
MSYIEDFLEANIELPKDFIRNLKLVREIDEKVSSKIKNYKVIQSRIDLNKKKLKTKVKLDKPEAEVHKEIQKDLEMLSTLSDHKIETVNECQFLIEHHLSKLSEKIEGYEKYTQTLPPLIADKSYDNTDSISVMTTNSTKLLI